MRGGSYNRGYPQLASFFWGGYPQIIQLEDGEAAGGAGGAMTFDGVIYEKVQVDVHDWG